VACLFVFFTLSFTGHMFFILIKPTLSIIHFMNHVLGVASKKLAPYSRSSRFSPMFASRSFIVLHFTLRSTNYFEFIFVKHVKSVSQFIFFACGCPVVLLSFVEKTTFPSLCYFCFLVKNNLVASSYNPSYLGD
jgi:hypothetical protein